MSTPSRGAQNDAIMRLTTNLMKDTYQDQTRNIKDPLKEAATYSINVQDSGLKKKEIDYYTQHGEEEVKQEYRSSS